MWQQLANMEVDTDLSLSLGSCVRCWTARDIGIYCNFCLDGSKMLRIVNEYGEQINSFWISRRVNTDIQTEKPSEEAWLEANDFFARKSNFQYLVKPKMEILDEIAEGEQCLYGVCPCCLMVGPLADFCNFCVDPTCRFQELRVIGHPSWRVNCKLMAKQHQICGGRILDHPGYASVTVEQLWDCIRNSEGFSPRPDISIEEFLLPPPCVRRAQQTLEEKTNYLMSILVMYIKI